MAAACVYTLHTMPNALQIGEIDNRMLPWLRSLQGTYYKTLNMTDETRHCEGIGQPSLNIDQWLQASLTVRSSGLIYMIINICGEHRDYNFTSCEFRSSDVTIGDHRFEVVKRIADPVTPPPRNEKRETRNEKRETAQLTLCVSQIG